MECFSNWSPRTETLQTKANFQFRRTCKPSLRSTITTSELGTLTINHVAFDALNFHHVLVLPSLILSQTTEHTILIIFCIYFMLEGSTYHPPLDKHSQKEKRKHLVHPVIQSYKIDSFCNWGNTSMYFTYYNGEVKLRKKGENCKADTRICS